MYDFEVRYVFCTETNQAARVKGKPQLFCHQKLLSARSVLIHTENNSRTSTFPPKNLSQPQSRSVQCDTKIRMQQFLLYFRNT